MGNPVVHFEVYGPDAAQLRDFYGPLFGWRFMTIPSGDYSMVDTQSGAGIPGGVAGGQMADGVDQSLLIYVRVPDIDAVLARITAAGGAVVRPRTEYGPVTTALFRDPQGNV